MACAIVRRTDQGVGAAVTCYFARNRLAPPQSRDSVVAHTPANLVSSQRGTGIRGVGVEADQGCTVEVCSHQRG